MKKLFLSVIALCACISATSADSIVIFEETFASGQGNFTINNVSMNDNLKFVWNSGTASGISYMKATTNGYAAESWLISPAIDTRDVTTLTLTFDHAAKKQNGNLADEFQLMVAKNPSSTFNAAEWENVTIPTMPASGSWTFVSSGDINLSDYAGVENMRIAFRCVSSTTDTYRMKGVKIVGKEKIISDYGKFFYVYNNNGNVEGYSIAKVDSISFKKSVETTTANFENGHAWVDLGLPSGLLWATMNVGAGTPEEDGALFAWGETYTKGNFDFDADNYKWYECAKFENRKCVSYDTLKYNQDDSLSILEAADDAATVNWGGRWRMPTIDEWIELLIECTATWRSGYYELKASNGNSILLPFVANCGGYTDRSYYWSALKTKNIYFFSNSEYHIDELGTYNERYYGYAVRPVLRTKTPPTNNIILEEIENGVITPSKTTAQGGEIITLDIVPDYGYTLKSLSVTCGEKEIIIYYDDYYDLATSFIMPAGEAKISAKFTATDSDPTGKIDDEDYVDLGLPSGLKWATSNVYGGTYGSRFAWGETTSKSSYLQNNYKFGSYLTKYCNNSEYGYTDKLTTLEPEDDVATTWGDNWRIPTIDEWNELINECTWTWTTLEKGGFKKSGYLVKGPNGNSIFLYSYGVHCGIDKSSTQDGYYWSSSLDTSYPINAQSVTFDSTSYGTTAIYSRYCGMSVRPVSSAETVLPYYSISISETNNGKVTASSEGFYGEVTADSAQMGDKILLNISPNPGYALKSINVMIGNRRVKITNNSFLMPMGDVNISATFDVAYKIAVMETEMGTITTSTTSAPAGDKITISVSPNSNYVFRSLSVMCGEKEIPVTDNTFVMPEGDVTISANYAIKYGITVAETEKGVVTASTTSAPAGDKIKINISPDLGYALKSLSVMCGKNELAVNDSSFVMPEGEVKISATFEAIDYKITIAETENGAITSSTAIAHIGDKISLNIIQNSGYALSSLIVEYGEERVKLTKKSFVMPANDVKIIANFSFSTGTDNGYTWIELASGVKWATMNVGATAPEEMGNLYAWGETSTKTTYDWTNYKHANGTKNTLTKYCNNSSCGNEKFTDTLTVLDATDDAATTSWGGHWRMPTKAEWAELCDANNCTWTWTTLNNVEGYEIKAFNGNSIFIPAVGAHSSDATYHISEIMYWTSSFNTGSQRNYFPYYAYGVQLHSDGHMNTLDYRNLGHFVRPVYDEKIKPRYNISFTEKKEGTIALSTTTAQIDQKVTFKIMPRTGYMLQSLNVMCGPNEVTVTDNSFIMPTGNVEISFTFTKDTAPPTIESLSGIFSVAADKTVKFSPGNLQCILSNTDTIWTIARHQYDMIGSANITTDGEGNNTLANEIDLFGWSTNGNTATKWGISSSTSTSDYGGDFVDWGQIFDDGNTWRTLTRTEWSYLLNARTDAKTLKGVARIILNEDSTQYVNGLIILPDKWTCPSGITFNTGFSSEASVAAYGDYQTFSLSEWEKLETAGALFLPAAGYRSGTSTYSGYQEVGRYWSSTYGGTSDAYHCFFNSKNAYSFSLRRSNGYAVRLVQDVK